MAVPSIQANGPQITVGGRTFAVGAFIWNTPDGASYTFGVFEQKSNGWDFAGDPNYIAMYMNPGEMMVDVTKKGGIAAWFAWFVGEVNKQFAKLFGGLPPPPITEPTTDDEALAWVVSKLATMKLTLVNGIPVLA